MIVNRPRFNELCAEADLHGCVVGITVTDQLVERRTNLERRDMSDIVVTQGITEIHRARIAGDLDRAANVILHKNAWPEHTDR